MAKEFVKNLIDYFPESENLGEFRINKFEIESGNFRAIKDRIPVGTYVRLANSFECVMSNTPFEEITNRNFIREAHGNVLVAGLGIGMIIMAIQEDEDVKSITIIEKHKDVIDLVQPKLPLNKKVSIICSDIFDFVPPKGTKYDTIYFDIWSNVCSANLEEMKILKKKFRKYQSQPGAILKGWAEDECKRQRAKGL